MSLRLAWATYQDFVWKKNKGTGYVVQVVEHLPSEWLGYDSNGRAGQKRQKQKKRKQSLKKS
jgi:hypothetical protein